MVRKALYSYRKEHKLCTNCGIPLQEKTSRCSSCLKQLNKRRTSLREERIKKNQCIICGISSKDARCEPCKTLENRRSRESKNRRKNLGLCVGCGKPQLYSETRCLECYSKHRNANVRYKALVFRHYGNICQCCKEAEPGFLTIDHVHGGGDSHREELGTGAIYSWLVKNEFPEGYRTLCYNCNCASGRKGRLGCPHKIPPQLNTYYWKMKNQVLAQYGKKCHCCSEDNIAFLTIDHIHNNGAAHRKRDATANNLVHWLIKNGFPKGFQVSCYNCNCGRDKSPDKVCPHRRENVEI